MEISRKIFSLCISTGYAILKENFLFTVNEKPYQWLTSIKLLFTLLWDILTDCRKSQFVLDTEEIKLLRYKPFLKKT